FFFSSRRRHTRFSRDWSSDVCSSDLLHRIQIDALLRHFPQGRHIAQLADTFFDKLDGEIDMRFGRETAHRESDRAVGELVVAPRSEERRVGKECRSRWWGDR